MLPSPNSQFFQFYHCLAGLQNYISSFQGKGVEDAIYGDIGDYVPSLSKSDKDRSRDRYVKLSLVL